MRSGRSSVTRAGTHRGSTSRRFFPLARGISAGPGLLRNHPQPRVLPKNRLQNHRGKRAKGAAGDDRAEHVPGGELLSNDGRHLDLDRGCKVVWKCAGMASRAGGSGLFKPEKQLYPRFRRIRFGASSNQEAGRRLGKFGLFARTFKRHSRVPRLLCRMINSRK